MATGIKGICYNETSQLNSVDFKPSHIRKLRDGTQHFTKLSSKIFDNVIYESIYGVSLPGMTDDIMGGSSKRYSSILTDSGNNIKRRSIDRNDTVDCKSNDLKMVAARTEKKAEEIVISEPPDTDVQQKNLKNLESPEQKEVLTTVKQMTPVIRTRKSESIYQHTNSTDENVGKQDTAQPEVISLEKGSSDNGTEDGDPETAENSRFRSNSECIGRTPRNSNQVDITSNPLYKEIYANNLRQYGFLLAKKLGISNQSPKELRATYLQNRQRAELRRERSNSSFSDFSKRLNKPPSPSTDGRRISMPDVPVIRGNTESTELPPKNRMQRSNTIGGIGSTTKKSPDRTRIIQRSNTVEYLEGAKDPLITSSHSRSFSDLTNKYSDSLTNISDIAREKDSNKPRVTLRRMKKSSNVELCRNSYSPPSTRSSCSSNSTDDINKDKDLSLNVDADTCSQQVHQGAFSDKEPSKKQPTTVTRRKHKNIRDPHKRLSVPLFNTNNRSSSPPQHTRRLSLPIYTNTDARTSMASLSVPDLYHNSSFGKEQLMDAYCKQDVPRKKLSVESLRRHNEAKDRLEWRLSKLKTFESLLSEADTFMKEVRTMSASISTVSATITEETSIPE